MFFLCGRTKQVKVICTKKCNWNKAHCHHLEKKFMIFSRLKEDRWKLKQYSLLVSLYHQARDTKAQNDTLPFLLMMKPFRSQESKIYCFREKMQNFTCLCRLVFRALLGGAMVGTLVHVAFDF